MLTEKSYSWFILTENDLATKETGNLQICMVHENPPNSVMGFPLFCTVKKLVRDIFLAHNILTGTTKNCTNRDNWYKDLVSFIVNGYGNEKSGTNPYYPKGITNITISTGRVNNGRKNYGTYCDKNIPSKVLGYMVNMFINCLPTTKVNVVNVNTLY